MTIDFATTGVFSLGATAVTKLTINSNGSIVTPNSAAFYGQFASGARTNAIPVLSGTTRNATLTGASGRITVPVAGYYHVYAQQLVNTSGGAYLHIRKNGVTVAYAYSNDDTTYDLVVAANISLAANEYIDFYYQGVLTESWTTPHSSVALFLIG